MALLVAIGLMDLRGLARLSIDMGSMYSASTVPIEDLAAMQAAALKIRLQMRNIQALHEQDKAAELVADIGKEQKKLDAAWHDYYPAKVTTADERRLVDRVATVLAIFRTQSDDIAEVLRTSNLDLAAFSIGVLTEIGDALSDAIGRDTALSATQARQLPERGNAHPMRCDGPCSARSASALSRPPSLRSGCFGRSCGRGRRRSVLLGKSPKVGWGMPRV